MIVRLFALFLSTAILIAADGQTTGAVSGGCLERDVILRAQQVIERGDATLATYDTTDEDDVVFGVGLGCRGVIRILIEPLPRAGDHLPVLEAWLPRREPGQVVDAELLLDGGDLLDRLLEPLLAEEPVLLLLELLAEVLEPLRRDELVQGRKQHCVLPRFVWVIHADELTHRINKFSSIIRILECLIRREMHRDVSQPPSGLMLLQKHVHKID